jgi:hypothetical protein
VCRCAPHTSSRLQIDMQLDGVTCEHETDHRSNEWTNEWMNERGLGTESSLALSVLNVYRSSHWLSWHVCTCVCCLLAVPCSTYVWRTAAFQCYLFTCRPMYYCKQSFHYDWKLSRRLNAITFSRATTHVKMEL